jgi:hypothetical protein
MLKSPPETADLSIPPNPNSFTGLIKRAHSAGFSQLISPPQLDAALEELPTAWARYGAIGTAIENASHEQKTRIAQMSMLVHARAGKQKRKNSDEPVWCHCFRVTAEALDILEAVGMPAQELAETAVSGIGHDLIEDFETTEEMIKALFGAETARSIVRMTILPPTEAVVKYPMITNSFITHTQRGSLPPAEYVNNLKARHYESYLELLAKLKHHGKSDGAQRLSLAEVVLRAEDNADSIRSYNCDVNEGALYISPSSRLGPPPLQAAPPRPYSMREARRAISTTARLITKIFSNVLRFFEPRRVLRERPWLSWPAIQVLRIELPPIFMSKRVSLKV